MNNNLTPEEVKYQQALKRVKRIKGFYTHLMIYIVINAGFSLPIGITTMTFGAGRHLVLFSFGELVCWLTECQSLCQACSWAKIGKKERSRN